MNIKKLLPTPVSLNRMIEIAEVLSAGFPEVRVDLYEVGGNPYFGELTFTSNGGFNSFYTKDFMMELGSQIKLQV